MSLLLAASLLVSCKNKDETDTSGETGGPDTDTDCQATDWFTDSDADGFGDADTLVSACEAPNGTVDQSGDCDDADAAIHPGATETCNEVDDDCDGTVDDEADFETFYVDADDDGFGDPAVSVQACEAPEGYVADGTDCDDTNVAFNPGATEEDCQDPNDYNCDGSVGFADADSDGAAACVDCDDADPLRFPDALETCNLVDDDCDGATDEEAIDQPTWYADGDGDGYGIEIDTLIQCDEPIGYVTASGDCDDEDVAWNPGATETCDDANDYNCDGSVAFADVDGDGFAACDDCDDDDEDVNPDADEVCNGVDDDCSGSVDDGASDAPTWYFDNDSDGYGDSLVTVEACDAPSNHVSMSADCDDEDAAYNPGADETCDDPTDYNCDGSVAYADLDEDGFAACDDCDDTVATSNPDGVEICNAADDDCDGLTDEPDATDATTWYADTDGDGYGDPETSIVACAAPSGYVADDTDCDDTNEDLNPESVWYADGDGDKYGDATDTMTACEQPTGYIATSGDCDDAVGTVNPDGEEVCNDVDDDCDGDVDTDASDASTWYADGDTDGYGSADAVKIACDQPTGFVADDTDCDDAVATTFPGADETCNLEDDDCNGTIDDDYATDAGTWWYDGDGDGFGGSTESAMACEMPADHAASSTDCADDDEAVNPGATEVCDDLDLDEDCDGTAEDKDTSVTGQGTYYTDGDGDSYGGTAYKSCDVGSTASGDCDDSDKAINPGMKEICDDLDVDEDCDGASDDADSSVTGQGTYYTDGDGDSYGGTKSYLSCDAGISSSTDCDDGDKAVNPGATEVCDDLDLDEDCDGKSDDGDTSVTGQGTYYTDADGDTYGGTKSYLSCDAGISSSSDCNDGDKLIHPGATEVCDDLDADEDCDGKSDDDDTSVTGQGTYYADEDGDTYGGTAYESCDAGSTASGDCNDGDKAIHPGATEVCDALDTDEDCDGDADDKDSSVKGQSTWFTDADVDGYGGTKSYLSCETGISSSSDCNDGDKGINPGATEVCDALDVDENCNGTADDEDSGVTGQGTYYTDGDGDLYGGTTSYESCDVGISSSNDCNDAVKAINPGATEVCDDADLDEDCDGSSDDKDSSVKGQGTYYTDRDGDTYPGSSTYLSCDAGFSSSSDCLDTDETINPGATEIAGDGIDQDCDGADADQIDYAHHQHECKYSASYGEKIVGYGWVYMAGVTDKVGQGPGIEGDFGYGPAGSDPTADSWTWTAGKYLGDKDGLGTNDNDEYEATVVLADSGELEVAWRFTVDGGLSYVYGDLGSACGGNGSDDGYNNPAPLTVVGIDGDGDGYDSVETGGDDCNDGDKGVNPGATETADDGIDQDCTGGDNVSNTKVEAGELVFTEMMYDPTPTDDLGEYFEIYNTSTDTILLSGLYVADAAGGVTVTGDYRILPGDWFVFGRTTDTATNGGITVDYAIGSSILLNNSGDTLYIETVKAGTSIDKVVFTESTPWPTPGGNGYSLELNSKFYNATDNDNGANWCKATTLYNAADKGTPGAANTGC